MTKKQQLVDFKLYFEEVRTGKLKVRDKFRLRDITVKQINAHHKMLQSK